MEPQQHGVWSALDLPTPLAGYVVDPGTPGSGFPSWRTASTDGMELGSATGQDDLAQLFLNLESLPGTDAALGMLQQQQQQQTQHFQQQQPQYPHAGHYPPQPLYPQQPASVPVFDLPQIEPFVKDERLSPPVSSSSPSPASSSSCSASPATASSSSSSSSSLPGISVTAGLFHKPRGSQGQWVGLLANDRIRVTKGKGKKLRLEVRCTQAFDLAELAVWLADDDYGTSVPGPSSFTVDPTKSKIEMETTGACVATIEVNLIKISKQLQFGVRVASKHGWTCQSATLPFTAHNNGKDRVQHGAPVASSVLSSPTSPGSGLSQPGSSPDPYALHQPYAPAAAPVASGKKRKVSTQMEGPGSSPHLHHQHGVADGSSSTMAPAPGANERVTQLEGSLRVEGDVRARAFIQYSDLRLKTDIASLVDALHVIEQLEPKSYRWRPGAPGLPPAEEDGAAGRRVIGLIAQEVQKVVPEVVYQDPVTGYLSVAYAELVPVIIEALKEHLKEYATDKAQFQQELAGLRAALTSLESRVAPAEPSRDGRDTGDDDDADDSAPATGGNDDDDDDDDDYNDENDDNDGDQGPGGSGHDGMRTEQDPREVVRSVNQRKRELRELARQLNQIKRDAKRQHRQEKRDRRAEKQNGREARRAARNEAREAKAEQRRTAQKEKKRFQEHLMMDPMKLSRDVVRYQPKAFKLATRRGARLAVALFWDRGALPDLTLHVHHHQPGMILREHVFVKKRKCCTIVTVQGLPRLEAAAAATTRGNDSESESESGSDDEEDEDDEEDDDEDEVTEHDGDQAELRRLMGQYHVSVTLHGGFAYHLKQSRAVVAIYDFRDASTPPLTVSSTSVAGDSGQTWLVGSFLIAPNVFRMTQMPNVIAPSVPSEWKTAACATNGDASETNPSRAYGLLPRRVYLRAAKGHSRYLAATRNGALAASEGPAPGFDEAWDIEFDVDGFASLRSSHGAYLSVDPKGGLCTAEPEKAAPGATEKFRYLLDDASSTLALVALLPSGPAYVHVSPATGELAAADALRPYVCDGEEALPGQREGGAGPSGAARSPTVVRHKKGADHMDDDEDDDDDDDDDEDDSGGSAEEEPLAPGGGARPRPGADTHDRRGKKQPLQQQQQQAAAAATQMRLPVEAERWVMEAAPTRDQQQARQAQEMWTQLQANLSLLSLSSSLRNRPPPS